MILRIPSYHDEYRVVSVACDEKARDDLLSESVELLYITSEKAVIYPDLALLTDDPDDLGKLLKCNDYDVLEILEDGRIIKCYDDSTSENLFFITEKCNSNCVMCPSPDASRRRGKTTRISDLIRIASHIPSDASHITITGGEPFMVGKELFELLDFCKSKFAETEFQILTNGRALAIRDYCELLDDTAPYHTILGIPLHGSSPAIHDEITRSDGSFSQTCSGLRHLEKSHVGVEIRIVVCKPNIDDLPSIAHMITREYGYIDHVSIMAMEMTGNALVNAENVWISYRDSFVNVKQAIEILINSGINVRLYNFPLCTVEPKYHMLCARSISSWKVRYSEVCDECTVKDICGGVFSGSIRFEGEELRPI